MSKICSPVSFGPASPDAGAELLRQLFLQCMHQMGGGKSNTQVSYTAFRSHYVRILEKEDCKK
jgi:hypothetical protein